MKSAFVAYWKAVDDAANAGGANELPPELAELVIGTERTYQQNRLMDLKRRGFAGTGYGAVKTMRLLSSISTSSTRAKLFACVDQTEHRIMRNGKPYTKSPQYVRVRSASLQRDQGRWKVAEVLTNAVAEGFTCDNYS